MIRRSHWCKFELWPPPASTGSATYGATETYDAIAAIAPSGEVRGLQPGKDGGVTNELSPGSRSEGY